MFTSLGVKGTHHFSALKRYFFTLIENLGTKQNSAMQRTGQFRTVNPKAQQKKKA